MRSQLVFTRNIPDVTALALLAEELLALQSPGQAAAYFLSGPLGVGKTTLAQQLLQHMGVTEPVTSPTFSLLQHYTVPGTEREVVHMDCYRMEDAEEFFARGGEEAAADPRLTCLVEWPEKLSASARECFTAPQQYTLALAYAPDGGRTVTVTQHTPPS
ncbi:tRNA (adenosine(37)-N6)-threonylcarbamoyltransferase complex ATPase subunit type 1 TsaE [Candidatus Peribacteria bacterium]|nr:tRNA (adenosine(37)-N6)-threonylcarbamoyltransferase complex ATPase subunit type 1 TsaE [Candidatus Peribacteria bacterium]